MFRRELFFGTVLCLIAIPAGAQSGPRKSDGPRGQYRGPYDEVLRASGGISSGGTAIPGDPTVAAEGYNRWEFWFEINKDILLRALDRRRREVITARPAGAPNTPGARIDSNDVRGEILPVLSLIARQSEDPDLRATALLGLGRLGTSEALLGLEECLASGRPIDRKYAVLALGMIPHAKARSHLLEIFTSAKESAQVRAHAAIAMGMQGQRPMIRALVQDLEQRLTSSSAIGEREGVAVAAVTALGMGEPATRTLSVPFLVQAYQRLGARKTRSRELLATMVSSLGKLRDPAGLATILAAMADKDLQLRRAAALACGEIGSVQAVKPLAELIAGGGDQQSKGFACLSLGRIGGKRALELLRELLQSRKSRTVQSFAALALGLARDKASVKTLRKLVEMNSEEDLRGSFAIALGLLRDQQSTERLFKILRRRGADPDLRGYAAIALGLIRPEKGLEKMLAILEKDRDRHEGVLRGVLLAVGLWRDPAASEALIAIIAREKRDDVRGSAVQALNMIRDRKAIAGLTALAMGRHKRGVPKSARLFALAALAGLGERTNYPLYAEAFYGTNYRLRIPLLDDLMQYL